MGKSHERTPYEELAKGFEASSVFGHLHSYDLYRNWLEAVWAFLEGPNNPAGYKECLDRYTFEQGGEFGRLLSVYTAAVEQEPFRDILGELFMRLDVNSVRSGQFMTPWPIAEMMVRMQFSKEDFERHVQEKGEVTVCDPAVGSGVMLLAFAKVVHDEFGRWGVNKLRLYGTDIDMRCVLMCRIQLRMNGLDSFGRLAGLIGRMTVPVKDSGLLQGADETRMLPSATAVAGSASIIGADELAVGVSRDREEERTLSSPTPDLSEAVVLGGMKEPDNRAAFKQLVLF